MPRIRVNTSAGTAILGESKDRRVVLRAEQSGLRYLGIYIIAKSPVSTISKIPTKSKIFERCAFISSILNLCDIRFIGLLHNIVQSRTAAMSATETETLNKVQAKGESRDHTDFDPNEISYIPTTGVRKLFETPLVQATPETIKGYGEIVSSPDTHRMEIVRWPAQGWRPVDANSGDQGGITEGLFEFWWKGDTLYARNNAVDSSYLFAWSQFPEEAKTDGLPQPRERALIWRANYHPDGGQLFLPDEWGKFRRAVGVAWG